MFFGLKQHTHMTTSTRASASLGIDGRTGSVWLRSFCVLQSKTPKSLA